MTGSEVKTASAFAKDIPLSNTKGLHELIRRAGRRSSFALRASAFAAASAERLQDEALCP
jgi:hypothetical protein